MDTALAMSGAVRLTAQGSAGAAVVFGPATTVGAADFVAAAGAVGSGVLEAVESPDPQADRLAAASAATAIVISFGSAQRTRPPYKADQGESGQPCWAYLA